MKILALVNQPVGMVSYSPSRKEWIMSAIGAAAGIASSLIGGGQAAQAAKAAEARQRRQEAEENARYTRRYNENYVDTAAGQNLVRKAKDFANRQWKKAAGAQAVAGGTDASAQMAKDAGNKMVGDTIANIAANDVARKDSADRQHEQAQQRFAQMDMNREMQRAQNISNAAQSASNAIMQAGAAIDQTSVKPTNLQGGSNNSTPVADATQTPTVTAPNAVTTEAYNSGRTPTDAEWQDFRSKVGSD
jgi:hypothetical protein